MGDRSSRKKEAATVSTAGCWRSCCRRCGRKKRKLDNHLEHHHHHQVDNQEVSTMSKTRITDDPCNPLSYFLDRQIDGKVDYCKKLVKARFTHAENFFRKDLYSHYGCINAIEFSKEGDLLISGGDDKRVLLWNVEKAIQEQGKPTVMKAQHMSNIFCLGYNSSKSKIFSAGNDDQVIVHDLQTTDVLNCFRHEKPVYGLSVHPHNDNVFASACDDGRVLIYDIRGSTTSSESFSCVAQYKNPFHSVMFSPLEPVMLATANAKEGVSMWDVRKPLKPVLRYGSEGPAQSCMNVRFNKAGTKLLAIRRRLPPVLYAVNSAAHLCQFDHPGYYNSCTMKSCCYAGYDDEYILSGSDDFNLYMWKIPNDDSVKWVDSAHMILRGHRSIVNQVRYNQASCVLASSGVEKIIKLWSPFSLGDKCLGGLKRDDAKEEKQRRVYTHDEYIALVLRSGQFMSHDYSHQSTDEDQRMMAFFDSLVQREIESWSSEDLPTPQSPSSPENNNTTDRNNISDSEDSSASDHQLESPNRITLLIANRREKLMRLATLEGTSSQSKHDSSTTSNNSVATTTPANTTATSTQSALESASASEPENNHVHRKVTTESCNTPLTSKGVKRKCSSRLLVIRNRARRKLNNIKDDSDSDPDEPHQSYTDKNNYQPIDATQPSTSSGVISRRSRYTTAPLVTESRQRRSRSSSSSSEDNNSKLANGNAAKRRSVKTDSDSSAKEPQKRKASHSKSRTLMTSSVQTRRENRGKGKRQKINHENESKSHSKKETQQLVHNGRADKETTPTPTKNSKHAATTDSGINSGVSTTEKNGMSTAEKPNSRSRTESSDHERMAKNFEWFKKRVDMARRGYRKRVMLPSSSSSDSSDD